MSDTRSCDIAIVGAGPAGAMAAIEAAAAGRNVCLIERKVQAGLPVRCGEGIGIRGLTRSIALDERWVKNRVRSVRLVSPSGIAVDLREFDEGLILDRATMESDLVARAQAAGAVYYNNTTVLTISKKDKGYILGCADGRFFQAPCVILAEGVESRLARQLGWKTDLELDDIETCAFAHVAHPSIEQDFCGFYLGRTIAPGGYGWIFPRGNGSANVGLGVIGSEHRPGLANQLLDRFIESRFPGAKVSDRHCGGVPVGKWLRPLTRDGVMLAGDAARQVNCLHGGGIAYSLFAGKTAGSAAALAFGSGTFNRSGLKSYEREWKRLFARQQGYSFSLKTMVIKYSDNDLNGIARALVAGKQSKITYLKVLMRAFAGKPVLMIKAFLMAR